MDVKDGLVLGAHIGPFLFQVQNMRVFVLNKSRWVEWKVECDFAIDSNRREMHNKYQ